MYKYLVVLSLLTLSACTFGKSETPMTTDSPKTPITTDTTVSTEMPKNAVVSLNYTLRE
jgi:hypothetical protein